MGPAFIKYYDEMFDYIKEGPVLIYGVHKNVAEQKMPPRYKSVYDFADWFRQKNIEAYTIDLFDKEADYHFDLNNPAPIDHVGRYSAVIDIGTLEHIFDTKQVLATSFSMVKMNGLYMLHTVANGLYTHGFYAFSPECIQSALTSNGFKLLYFKTSDGGGKEMSFNKTFEPTQPSLVMWVVSKKIESVSCFINPQQGLWKNMYL